MRSLVREKYVLQNDDKIDLKEEVYSLIYSFTHSFHTVTYYRSTVTSKAGSPHSAI